MIFGYLFIYLFEIMKQIGFFFFFCFQSISLDRGVCLINLDLKLVQQDDSSSKI